MSADSQTAQPLDGVELVASLMRRQDDVLLELDALNARVESTIKELSDARKAELEELRPEGDEGETQEDAEQAVEASKKVA